MIRFLCLLLVVCLAGPVSAQQETLEIATIARTPFAFENADGWTGFSIDLWRVIAEELGRDSVFTSTANFTELLGTVREGGTADAAIANISITFEREELFDFSQPIFDSGLIVLAPTSSGSGIFGVLFSYDLLIWLGGAFILLFVAANMIYLFERRTNPEFQHAYGRGLGEGLWWALNALLNAGFEIHTPFSRAGRLLAFALILMGLFVVGAFVAQITAALTVERLNAQVSGIEDLYDKRVGTTEHSTASNYMTARALRHKTYGNIEQMFAALESGALDAVVHDAPILSYYASTAGRGRFATVGRVFSPEKYGIALPSGSPLREPINRALLRLRENGTYQSLVEKWFGDDYG